MIIPQTRCEREVMKILANKKKCQYVFNQSKIKKTNLYSEIEDAKVQHNCNGDN